MHVLLLAAMLLGAPAPDPAPVGEASASETAAAATSLAFEVRRAAGGELARGVVVVLDALEVEGVATGHQVVERSADGARVRFADLAHGRYKVSIFSGGAELSFELAHDGSQLEPVRAWLPTDDRTGKGVAARPDRLFWGGVGATSLGAALLVGGALAVTLNPCGQDGATGGDCRSDLRTAWGIGLASVGSAGVGTGVTMIIVGHRQRLRLQPGVDAKVGAASFVLRGRF